MEARKPTIGFIGQGYIGKNYADDFESRGYGVIRYALEEPYVHNKGEIKKADVVFIAVPTPTTFEGFDEGIVREALSLPAEGSIVIIKSTILPGITKTFQKEFPHITLLFSPEFLREATAAHDAANPYSNIVGISEDSEKHKQAAELLLSILPEAPTSVVCSSTEAELIKYAQNISGYIDIITFNILYDLAKKLDADWEPILEAMKADPNIPSRFANPVHKSGRGAGGHCLIKDMAAFRMFYEATLSNDLNIRFLRAAEDKNKELLSESGKDIDLMEGVYGDE